MVSAGLQNGAHANGHGAPDPVLKPPIPTARVDKLQKLLPAHHASCGLNNLDNTCFLNSVLQCLAHLPPVVDAVMRRCLHGFQEPCPSLKQPNSKCAACLVEQQLRAQVTASSRAAISPRAIFASLNMFSKTFRKGRQEDSHEFLLGVLDAVERDTRRGILKLGGSKAQRTLVEELFCGRLRSQVKCLECGYCSNTYETITSLSLEIRAATLAESLAHFTAVEVLDGANKYKCDKCKRLVRAHKSLVIHHEPNCLVVHLKRFDALLMGGKVGRHVSFDNSLSLAPYLSDAPLRRGSKELGGSGGTQQGDGRSAVYMLQGVVVHQGGSINSGHYYAYVRNSQGMWFEANDCSVTPVPASQVFASQAYMLFYTRTALKPLELPPSVQLSPDSAPPAAPDHVPASAKLIGPQLPPGMQRPQPQAAATSSQGTCTESSLGPKAQHVNGEAAGNQVLLSLARPAAPATKPSAPSSTQLSRGGVPRAVLLPAASSHGNGAVLKVQPAAATPAAAKPAAAATPAAPGRVHAPAAGGTGPQQPDAQPLLGKRAREEQGSRDGASRAGAAGPTALEAGSSRTQEAVGEVEGRPSKRRTPYEAEMDVHVKQWLTQQLSGCAEFMQGLREAAAKAKQQGMSLEELLSAQNAASRRRVTNVALHAHATTSDVVKAAVARTGVVVEKYFVMPSKQK